MNKSFITLVQEERDRQLFQEGFTKAHDDAYKGGELARAAVSYATPPLFRAIDINKAPFGWPWEPEWWKPTPDDRQREIIKSAALMYAEWDRIERLKEK